MCEHLIGLDKELKSLGIRETYRGQPWSENCREWAYYDCVLALFFVIGLNTVSSGQTQSPLKISALTDRLYVYTTYNDFNGTSFPSNGMYFVTNIGVVLFDTPWDPTQFQPLLDSIAARHQKKVIYCVATHFHDDSTAGVEFYRRNGVRTYSSKMTYDLCGRESPENQPEFYFARNTTFDIHGSRFEVYYPGEGHTRDNIVVWFPAERVLFGGCLVKSTENDDIGNIADANLDAWGPTIRDVMKRYPDPGVVVPGHFGWSRDALSHTLKIVEKHRKK